MRSMNSTYNYLEMHRFLKLYLQQGVLGTNDHHFPFINVFVIYEAS